MTRSAFRAYLATEQFKDRALGWCLPLLVRCLRRVAAVFTFPLVFGWLLLDASESAQWWDRVTGDGGTVLALGLLVGFCASGYVAYRAAAWVAAGTRKKERP